MTVGHPAEPGISEAAQPLSIKKHLTTKNTENQYTIDALA